MPADGERLRALADEVGRFYVTDRSFARAHARFTAALAGGEPPAADIDAYLAAVRRYFSGFEREARSHLSDVEKRLARVSQVQFNLTAERDVAVRRVATTQGVLSQLAELARP
jgi:hypothetical protein